MRSELPVLAHTRHHWIVLFRPPPLWAGIALGLLVVWAWVSPALSIVAILLIAAAMFFRWQTWHAEQIILTRHRIIRVQGVPETTSTEAFLRVDRISGMQIVQTVPGKLLDYATIELEAPGSHPGVRHLVRIWHPHEFYRELRQLIFGGPDRSVAEPRAGDPDDVGTVTARLPRLRD